MAYGNNYGFGIEQREDARYIDGRPLDGVVDGIFAVADKRAHVYLAGILALVRLRSGTLTEGDRIAEMQALEAADAASTRVGKAAAVTASVGALTVPDMDALPAAPTSPAPAGAAVELAPVA